MAVNKKLDKLITVIVKPATDNAYKEGYAFANGKVIPFDVKVKLEDRDIKVLQSRREARKVDPNGVNVHELMDQLRIPQEKANAIAKSNGTHMNGKVNSRRVNKYNVIYV